jgi:hypothetical protein
VKIRPYADALRHSSCSYANKGTKAVNGRWLRRRFHAKLVRILRGSDLMSVISRAVYRSNDNGGENHAVCILFECLQVSQLAHSFCSDDRLRGGVALVLARGRTAGGQAQ